MAVAFDKDGKEVAHASDTLDGAIPQAAYDAVMKQGLPANQEIELKPGTYNLRLGVMDRATQQIGTVDVPLEIFEDQSNTEEVQGFTAKLSVRGQTAIGCAQDGLWQTCSKSPPAQSAEARPHA